MVFRCQDRNAKNANNKPSKPKATKPPSINRETDSDTEFIVLDDAPQAGSMDNDHDDGIMLRRLENDNYDYDGGNVISRQGPGNRKVYIH